MCSCNVQKFPDKGTEYVKKLCRFHCHCLNSHFVYVHACKEMPVLMQGFQKWTSVVGA